MVRRFMEIVTDGLQESVRPTVGARGPRAGPLLAVCPRSPESGRRRSWAADSSTEAGAFHVVAEPPVDLARSFVKRH